MTMCNENMFCPVDIFLLTFSFGSVLTKLLSLCCVCRSNIFASTSCSLLSHLEDIFHKWYFNHKISRVTRQYLIWFDASEKEINTQDSYSSVISHPVKQKFFKLELNYNNAKILSLKSQQLQVQSQLLPSLTPINLQILWTFLNNLMSIMSYLYNIMFLKNSKSWIFFSSSSKYSK